MKYSFIPIVLLITFLIATMFQNNSRPKDTTPAAAPEIPEGFSYIDLGAGCFWCVEAVYQRIDGIESVTSGYMGGVTENPAYYDVVSGGTGHAEIVRVVYNPKVIDTRGVLTWFWKLHDPTTLNRQGNDRGTQYRSAIFYNSDEQKAIAEASLRETNPSYNNKIVTEITKATTFYPAEVYHQDYYKLVGNRDGYCRVTIPPKLKKLGLEHKEEK